MVVARKGERVEEGASAACIVQIVEAIDFRHLQVFASVLHTTQVNKHTIRLVSIIYSVNKASIKRKHIHCRICGALQAG